MESRTVLDAPVIHPTMEQMNNFAELTARASDMAMRYGAVLIDPPAEWRPPPLRMYSSSRFFVRTQVLPESPFVDPTFVRNQSAPAQQPPKRQRKQPDATLNRPSREERPTKTVAGTPCALDQANRTIPNTSANSDPQPGNTVSVEADEGHCLLVQETVPKKPSRARKRTSAHTTAPLFNQDDAGRLTKPITFRFSETPISLHAYKKRAEMNLSNLHRKLCADQTWSSRISHTDNSWTKDVKCLEELFWHSMRRGLEGEPISVDYGVDVEAEGAFDTQDMSYAEWYGNTGKQPQAQPKKRPRTETQFVRRRKENAPIASRHVGNVNSDSLLRHLPKMPGINHSMYYVGQLFTRFCWHTEDGFLNSISYLHEGSAEKIWYAIPPEAAPLFEEYAAANIFSPTLADEEGSGQALLMNKTTMFDPREVARHGVPVYRVTHRPRSIVVTGPRAYHAGFNCGFNIAEAVNFAHPSWFPLGREASQSARTMLKPLCIPWEYLLYHEAKAIQASLLPQAREGKVPERMRTHAAIVAKELGRLIREGEEMIAENAREENLRIKMITEINAVVKNCQVGPEYGLGAGIVCTVCGHACHFYAKVCGCCEEGEEARCPEHFNAADPLCENKGHTAVLVRRHNPLMLLDVLDDVEDIGGVKTSPEDRYKRYKGFLRVWQTPLKKSGLCLRLDLLSAMGREAPKTKRKKESSSREKRKKPRLSRTKYVHFEDDKHLEDIT